MLKKQKPEPDKTKQLLEPGSDTAELAGLLDWEFKTVMISIPRSLKETWTLFSSHWVSTSL